MPTETAHVEVDAPLEAVFSVLVRDRTEFPGNNEVHFRERVGDEPMGLGYRYKATFIHRRHRCEMQCRISAFDRARVLEESYYHRCEVGKRTVQGTLRYELMPHQGGTTLIATHRLRISGPQGWLAAMLPQCSTLRPKLEFLASRVEATTDHKSSLDANGENEAGRPDTA
jgi:hypothetical protein